MKNKCKVCQRMFETKNPYTTCCGVVCLTKKMSGNSNNKVGKCIKCKKDYIKQHYSLNKCDECRALGKRRSVVITCVLCNDNFNSMYSTKKYCSNCKDNNLTEIYKQYRNNKIIGVK